MTKNEQVLIRQQLKELAWLHKRCYVTFECLHAQVKHRINNDAALLGQEYDQIQSVMAHLMDVIADEIDTA